MEEVMSVELVENLVDFCENRARVYALLSRCYEKELDAAFAAELAEAARVESDDPALAEGFAALQADLAGCDDGQLELLAVVFDRVFFGMGPRPAQKAFPYESVYTSEGGLMMQDAYSEVLRLYRAAGFAKDPGFTEPEDLLAVELLNWVPAFVRDMKASAESGFYAHLATFTEAYLAADAEALAEVVGD